MGRGGGKQIRVAVKIKIFGKGCSFSILCCFVQEGSKAGEINLKDFKEGQVQQLDLEEVNQHRNTPGQLLGVNNKWRD